MAEEMLFEHDTYESAEKRMNELKKKHPSANFSVIKGAKSGKHHVVRHTSGGMSMVEHSMPSFEEYLSEGQFTAEYHPVLKKHGFEKKGSKHVHPELGHVTINRHGEWKHDPKKGLDMHEGTTGNSLDRHLSRMQEDKLLADDGEDEVLDESLIRVDHDTYRNSHGHKAHGTGHWMVGVGQKHVDFTKHEEGQHYIQHNGKLTDAVKKAREAARKHGKTSVHILP